MKNLLLYTENEKTFITKSYDCMLKLTGKTCVHKIDDINECLEIFHEDVGKYDWIENIFKNHNYISIIVSLNFPTDTTTEDYDEWEKYITKKFGISPGITQNSSKEVIYGGYRSYNDIEKLNNIRDLFSKYKIPVVTRIFLFKDSFGFYFNKSGNVLIKIDNTGKIILEITNPTRKHFYKTLRKGFYIEKFDKLEDSVTRIKQLLKEIGWNNECNNL